MRSASQSLSCPLSVSVPGSVSIRPHPFSPLLSYYFPFPPPRVNSRWTAVVFAIRASPFSLSLSRSLALYRSLSLYRSRSLYRSLSLSLCLSLSLYRSVYRSLSFYRSLGRSLSFFNSISAYDDAKATRVIIGLVAISRALSLVNEHNSLPMQFPETRTNERREAKTGSKPSSILSDMCDSPLFVKIASTSRTAIFFREIWRWLKYLVKINLDEFDISFRTFVKMFIFHSERFSTYDLHYENRVVIFKIGKQTRSGVRVKSEASVRQMQSWRSVCVCVNGRHWEEVAAAVVAMPAHKMLACSSPLILSSAELFSSRREREKIFGKCWRGRGWRANEVCLLTNVRIVVCAL